MGDVQYFAVFAFAFAKEAFAKKKVDDKAYIFNNNFHIYLFCKGLWV